jgi:hypothetical protein
MGIEFPTNGRRHLEIEEFARLRAQLRQQGMLIGDMDWLIHPLIDAGRPSAVLATG